MLGQKFAGLVAAAVVVGLVFSLHNGAPQGPPSILFTDTEPSLPSSISKTQGTAAAVVQSVAPQDAESEGSSSGSATGTDKIPPAAVFPAFCFPNTGLWKVANCLEDVNWLVPWAEMRPNSSLIMVDVGANKGYVIAGWLQVLSRSEYASRGPRALGVAIFKT